MTRQAVLVKNFHTISDGEESESETDLEMLVADSEAIIGLR